MHPQIAIRVILFIASSPVTSMISTFLSLSISRVQDYKFHQFLAIWLRNKFWWPILNLFDCIESSHRADVYIRVLWSNQTLPFIQCNTINTCTQALKIRTDGIKIVNRTVKLFTHIASSLPSLLPHHQQDIFSAPKNHNSFRLHHKCFILTYWHLQSDINQILDPGLISTLVSIATTLKHQILFKFW